jgi:hypothetical protein
MPQAPTPPLKDGRCPKCGRFVESTEQIVGKEGMILKVEHGDGSQPCVISRPPEA